LLAQSRIAVVATQQHLPDVMVQGHWGGDVSGMILVLASLAAFVGIQAPWWGVPVTGLAAEKEVNMTLWGPAAGQLPDMGFEWGTSCKTLSTGGSDTIPVALAEADCSLIGWARAFAIVGVVMTFTATVAIAMNKSSVNQCLSAAACSAGIGALCNLVAVAVAVRMPLGGERGAGGLGFASMICSVSLSSLAAICMMVAKFMPKGGGAGALLAAERSAPAVTQQPQ